VRFGIPVTPVARTLGDLAQELDDEATYRMVREAQFRKLLHLPALELTHRRRPSRRPCGDNRRPPPTETPLEDLFSCARLFAATADRIRDNVLHLAGQLVLRYTTPDVTRRHRRVADQVREAIAARVG
jgi:hypothetical protein